MISEKAVEAAVYRVMRLLVENRYEELERITDGVRIGADEMRNIISDYGIEIIMPPAGKRLELDVVPVSQAETPTFSIVADVWTKDGKSDVSLEMTVKIDEGNTTIEVDNLHVR